MGLIFHLFLTSTQVSGEVGIFGFARVWCVYVSIKNARLYWDSFKLASKTSEITRYFFQEKFIIFIAIEKSMLRISQIFEVFDEIDIWFEQPFYLDGINLIFFAEKFILRVKEEKLRVVEKQSALHWKIRLYFIFFKVLLTLSSVHLIWCASFHSRNKAFPLCKSKNLWNILNTAISVEFKSHIAIKIPVKNVGR